MHTDNLHHNIPQVDILIVLDIYIEFDFNIIN